MANDALFLELAKALSQPSKAYQAATAALDVPEQALQGYRSGANVADEFRKRKLKQQTLGEALHGQPVEQGIMNFTGETGDAQDKNLATLATYLKAKEEKSKKGLQFVGTQGKSGLTFDPNAGSMGTIPLPNPNSDEPILPRTVTPTLSPYADSSGQPLAFTPGKGFRPVPSAGGTPVLKQGNEQAISDVALMATQKPNINALYDSYAKKGPIMARLQATGAGSFIDPVTKQAENSLKLAAFAFGGKNLTDTEKTIVYGAFFPSVSDNPQSLENKRKLLNDYFNGKIDLLQAANLLGPAGAPLSHMLQAKAQTPDQGALDPEAEAAIVRVQAANIPENEKNARISGIRAAAGQR